MATPLADIARMADRACGGSVIVRGLDATERFVEDALVRLNDAAPRLARITITGTDATEYTLASPWVQDQSTIEKVDVYAGADYTLTPQTLDPDSFLLGLSSGGADQLRFRDALATGDAAVVSARVPYTLTATATTLAAADYRALGDLAASLKLEAASAAVLAVAQQGSDEDVVNLGTSERADQFRALAASCRKRFDLHFGLTPAGTAEGSTEGASVAVADVDPHSGFAGGRYHTHSTRGAGL